MILILEVSSSQGAKPGVRRQEFTEKGGIIGRGNESSWVLPHAKVSGRHAVISCRNAVFYIEDTSRNGVCINSADNRLVRGRPYALKSGDRILIEPYEIHVSITAEPTRRPGGSRSTRRTCGRRALHSRIQSIRWRRSICAARGLAARLVDVTPAAEAMGGQELDPLKLLDPSPKLAPVRKAPGAKDLARGSLLEEHYQPPAVHPAPASPPPDAGR